jgi:hypothetical protein
MINGVTKTGFKFSVDKNCMNDMELVDVLADTSMDDAFRMSHVIKKLLPMDQRAALYDHVRVDGRVPVDAVVAAVEDIFTAIGNDGKNS